MSIRQQKINQNTQHQKVKQQLLEIKQQNKIDILCLGQINCQFSNYLQQFTGQSKQKNSIHNVYVKKMLIQKCQKKNNHKEQKLVFLHEWKFKEETYIFNQYDGIMFFIDLLHYLNNTNQRILKILETLSENNGINIFNIPIFIIAIVNLDCINEIGKKESFDLKLQKQRFQKKFETILNKNQIQYFYSSKINQKNTQADQNKTHNPNQLNNCVMNFFQKIFNYEGQGIKQSWKTIRQIYGILQIVQPYITEMKVTYFSFVQRLFPENSLKEAKKQVQSVNMKTFFNIRQFW